MNSPSLSHNGTPCFPLQTHRWSSLLQRYSPHALHEKVPEQAPISMSHGQSNPVDVACAASGNICQTSRRRCRGGAETDYTTILRWPVAIQLSVSPLEIRSAINCQLQTSQPSTPPEPCNLQLITPQPWTLNRRESHKSGA